MKTLLFLMAQMSNMSPGRLIGADSGIGGTYGVMPELFLKAEEFVVSWEILRSERNPT